VPPFSAELKATSGWLTQQEAATNLGISPMSLNRLIQQEIVTSEGAANLPQVIIESDLVNEAIQAAVKQIRSHANAPLPTNSKQKTLFFNPF
jgi:plasmid maintenance system antidote protein VapI